MRSGLLLTAVATVAAPGLLAVLGVAGHDHAAAPAGVAAVALAGSVLSGPFPVAPSTTRAAVRNDVAEMQQASGLPLTVLSRVTTAQEVTGTRLLDQAADASLTASYTGTEQVSETGVAGPVTLTSQVWHQGGSATLVAAADGVTSAAAASGSAEGVFGVSSSQVRLLSRHYVAAYAGGGSVDGRTAAVVELYRFDGTLAATYWLDRQTLVPLRRELFDTADHVVSDDSFVQVRLGAGVADGETGAARPQAAWTPAPVPARSAAALTAQGWRLPGTLPGGLPLYAAATSQTASGEVVDLEYSDGLYVVSLFVQRGTLAPSLAGWQPVRVAGQQAFVSGHSVTWASRGFVYTVIADAPAQTVSQLVGVLPASGQPGLLGRLGRGFGRLARLVDVFS
jgi:sigma-E factor negative regulatory protein RseB